MSKYIWYSGATDVTGKAIAEALGIEHGKIAPRNKDIIIGWGAKTSENVNLGDAKVLNHPNAILKNRNKFSALGMMKADRQLSMNVAKFLASDTIKRAIEREEMSLPLIGRTNFHQGGKGFWTCLTKTHVEKAISDGAQYFQEYIDIKTEYRLHVFDGKVIYATKKVENPTEAGWIAQRKEKVWDYARKNNVDINETTLDYVLGRLVKEIVLPDRIVRSNKRGWKFSSIAVNSLSATLKNAAIKSVEVVGLNFGAVDCAISVGDHPFIIEVNTAPGLQGTSFDKYIATFREKIVEIERPAGRAERPAAAPRVNNRVRRAVGANNANAAVNDANVEVNEEALVHMMNAVRNPEEARRILDLMGR